MFPPLNGKVAGELAALYTISGKDSQAEPADWPD